MAKCAMVAGGLSTLVYWPWAANDASLPRSPFQSNLRQMFEGRRNGTRPLAETASNFVFWSLTKFLVISRCAIGPNGQIDVNDYWLVVFLATTAFMRPTRCHDGGVDDACLSPAHSSGQRFKIATSRWW